MILHNLALPLILITSFDPFMGASVNNSNKVSHQLAKLLKDNFEVSECLVPTIYDQGFEKAKECLLALPRKPDLIISIGEGGACKQVELELQTHNLDDSWAQDNAGHSRENNTIIPNEPEYKKFVFFNDQAEEIVSKIPELRFSDDMGTFVCNNTAYHMTTYMENYATPRIPYAFFHVPPHSCNKRDDENLNTKESATAIAVFLTSIRL